MYGEISSAVTSTALFFASVFVPKCQNKGIRMTSANDAAVNGKGNDLRPPEVLVLRPDVLHLYGLAGEVRRRKLCREECLFDARSKTAEIGSPGDCQVGCSPGPFGTGRELKKSLKLSITPAPNTGLHEGASGAIRDLDGPLS